MKLLVISYYWPPANSVGVFRWLKFIEALIQKGIQVTVFCPENASYPMEDHSPEYLDPYDHIPLERVPIFEWRDLYLKFVPTEKSSESVRKDRIDNIFHVKKDKLGFKRKLSLWVRANMTIPDARASWIRPCSKAVIRYLEIKFFKKNLF